MLVLEGMQVPVPPPSFVRPKSEQKVAELAYCLQGLSDEVCRQSRRVDTVEDRLWGMRHELEEEFQKKYTDFGKSLDRIFDGLSSLTLFEDTLSRQSERLWKLESREELSESSTSDTASSTDVLHVPVNKDPPTWASSHESVCMPHFEQKLRNVQEWVVHETQDVYARVEACEELLRAMRVLRLRERIDHTEWDERLDEIWQELELDRQRWNENDDALKLLCFRLDGQAQAQAEFRVNLENGLSAAQNLVFSVEEWLQKSSNFGKPDGGPHKFRLQT